MGVSAISAGGSDWQNSLLSAVEQRSTDMNALGASLGANDLSGAQKAFASLLQDRQKLDSLRHGQMAQAAQAPQAAPTASNRPVVDDLQALQSALKAGDLSSAKSDLAKLLTDLQQAQKHHHRHGGMHGVQSTLTAGDDGDGDDATSGAASILSGVDLKA